MASKPYPDPKRGVWLMKYRPDPTGPWVRVNLGKDARLLTSKPPKSPPIHVADRAREFAEIEYNAKHGIKAAPARAKGLAGYAEAYLEGFAASRKQASVRQAKRHMKRFVEFAAAKGASTVQGVTRGLCREYLDTRIKTVSHDTLRTEVGYLRPLWTRAIDDNLVAKNPWASIKVPGKSTRSDPTFWTSDEVARIAAACGKAWQSDLVLVLANTGLRISTALAMRWEWVDWSAGLVRIPKAVAATKEGVKTSYSPAMTATARDVLQRRAFAARATTGLVFPNPYRDGGEVPYDSAREAIARAIRKAGVKPGTPHDLRHTFGRVMERTGGLALAQKQLGHASVTTTQLYTDASADEAAESFREVRIGEPTRHEE